MAAEQAGFVQGGVERFNDAYRSLDKGVQRIQKNLQTRIQTGRKSLGKQLSTGRRNLERQVASGRKSLERTTRKRVRELRKSPIVKRATSLREDVAKQLEEGVGTVLGWLQVASKSDLQRIDRRLGQINRKIKELERSRRSNGSAPAS